MDTTSIIIIVVLFLTLLALGVVAFVPIKGKKLLCPANKACPPASAADCKTEIDKATKDCNKNPAAFYDKAWCKSTYADIQTETTYCKNFKTAMGTYFDKVGIKSTSQYLIKRSAGTNVQYYTDTDIVNGQPFAMTVAAVEAWAQDARKIPDIAGVLGYLTIPEMPASVSSDSFKTEVALALNLFDKTKKITNGNTITAVAATETVSAISKIDSLWSKIGDGTNFSYSFLKIDKTALTNALTGDKTTFSQYCI